MFRYLSLASLIVILSTSFAHAGGGASSNSRPSSIDSAKAVVASPKAKVVSVSQTNEKEISPQRQAQLQKLKSISYKTARQ